MTKENHEIKVLKLVNHKKEQKTFELVRDGIQAFIGNTDRYLRWLAQKGLIVGERAEGKTYKQWSITQKGKEFLKELNTKQN